MFLSGLAQKHSKQLIISLELLFCCLERGIPLTLTKSLPILTPASAIPVAAETEAK